MVGVVLDLPLARGAGHDVEVVEVVARRRGDHVVALGDEHHVPVAEGQRLVEGTVLGVDPLDGEALHGLDPMVVGPLQVGLTRAVVLVVLVQRVARPVAAGRDDLDHQQPFGRAVLHQDRAYAPLHVPGAAHLHLHVLGPYQQRAERVRPSQGGRRRDRQLQVGDGLDPVDRPRRQVDRERRALEDAVALPDVPPLVVGGDGAVPGEDNKTDLFGIRATLDGPSFLEPLPSRPDRPTPPRVTPYPRSSDSPSQGSR